MDCMGGAACSIWTVLCGWVGQPAVYGLYCVGGAACCVGGPEHFSDKHPQHNSNTCYYCCYYYCCCCYCILVVEILDVTAIKRLLLGFEKQVLKNQEMRVKFPDQPDKFMESEIELNEELQKLQVISTVPELYNILIELNIIQTLVGILCHDNSDIAIAVVDLIQQLTDADLDNDDDDEVGGVEKMEQLIDALLDEQVINSY